MEIGAITSYVDVAQLVLYAFWAFFAGLIYYLVRENHREGYPLLTSDGRGTATGFPIPKPKTYLLPHGGEVSIPDFKADRSSDPTLAMEPAHAWAGSAYIPTGDPMQDGVGPGAWTARADVPDLTWEGGLRLTPLRVSTEYSVDPNDTDPRGLPVFGADGEVGGTCTDVWVDRSEHLFRYLELEPAGGGPRVLVPMNFVRMKRDGARVQSVLAHQLAHVPQLKSMDQITLLEEERLFGYFGGGTLYAEPRRAEPLV